MSDPGQTPPQGSPSPTPEDVRANKAVAAIAYLLFFVPLLAANHSRFAMYHANQGLMLLLALIACNILLGLIPLLNLLLVPLAHLVCLVFCVIGMMNAINGDMKPLPLIGRIEIIKHP
ncbi:hypothetical protein P9314_20520 [Paenibacillus validus]|uniref:DUF4870 domain-containing protein n=1 Tax=Paenibacillus validus TaxID=44253 RepID=A0A7X2ZG95_9BACL|nr:hypothetical protein [Paenibacillus validus]MED4603010.1 hypothetical protein [Paenibacillus validus]MED4608259.1 hypothetical protein [Paenibacillus validus]MUG73760.1 hypothetical protein [Paenibacillus validus]